MHEVQRQAPFLFLLRNAPAKIGKAFTLMAGGFVVTWFLANYAEPTILGEFQLAMSTISLLAITSLPGMKDAIAKWVAEGHRGVVVTGTRMSVRWSLVGSAVLVLVSVYYALIAKNRDLSLAFLFLAVLFPFEHTLNNFAPYLNSTLRFAAESLAYVAIAVVQISATMTAYWLLPVPPIVAIVAGYFGSRILCYSVFFLAIARNYSRYERPPDGLSRYAWTVTKVNSLALIANQIDRILLGVFVSPILLAAYAVAASVPTKAKSMLAPLLTALFPGIAQGWIVVDRRLVSRLLLLSIGGAIVIMIALPYVFQILFPRYQESVRISQGLAAVVVFQPANMVLTHAFRARGIRKGITFPIVVSRAIFLIILVPLMLFLQLWGIVLARIVEQVAQFAAGIYCAGELRQTQERVS